ncbi:hypothetical protein [Actinotignum urinale]|uniref:Uncharacterized protein n=1 Tax=Actinotignum urinale TaxID=190146 RepID=A0ABU5G8A3_9ACTO|nr:hypothetical protein [Actinotignum urinale]MDY5132910.1 hypothetical protein [Actinotignum urinale]
MKKKSIYTAQPDIDFTPLDPQSLLGLDELGLVGLSHSRPCGLLLAKHQIRHQVARLVTYDNALAKNSQRFIQDRADLLPELDRSGTSRVRHQ